MANLGSKSKKSSEGQLNPDFWRGKRVLLTGHTGFKGSWLTVWLTSMGAKVYGYALSPNTKPNMFNALALSEHTDHHVGDIRDLASLRTRMKQVDPDIIFHLAAQPIVKLSYTDPLYTFEVNALGTANVLDAARNSHAGSIVIVTSDKCYRPVIPAKVHSEADHLGGFDPYSASKSCAEIVSESYRASFFSADQSQQTSIITARAGNVYGGGDWAEGRLVVDAVRSFQEHKPLVLRQPGALRPWQHVLDPLRGYLLLAEYGYHSDAFSSAWNFGPPTQTPSTVLDVANDLASLWQGGVVKVDKATAVFKETDILQLDSKKAQTLLGWVPHLSLSEGLELAVEWYKAFYNGGSPEQMFSLTLMQLESTLKQAKKYEAAS